MTGLRSRYAAANPHHSWQNEPSKASRVTHKRETALKGTRVQAGYAL